jgi:hypothetical protein
MRILRIQRFLNLRPSAELSHFGQVVPLVDILIIVKLILGCFRDLFDHNKMFMHKVGENRRPDSEPPRVS